MQLYVIRHAIAEDHAEGQSDSERHLTQEGVKRLKRVVEGLRALGITFDRIVTSPWSRAFETAERLAPLCDHEPIATELLCQSPRAELLAMIAETGTDTAVVGHEPWLGELVAWLAFGDTRHGEALVLKKGGVVFLEGTAVPGGMQISAILPPKIISAAKS
jgi:phosphohistidine phosphatase